MNREIELDNLDLLHETNEAFKVSDGTTECWLPKSLVDYDATDGTFIMPEWLALKEGLI